MNLSIFVKKTFLNDICFLGKRICLRNSGVVGVFLFLYVKYSEKLPTSASRWLHDNLGFVNLEIVIYIDTRKHDNVSFCYIQGRTLVKLNCVKVYKS